MRWTPLRKSPTSAGCVPRAWRNTSARSRSAGRWRFSSPPPAGAARPWITCCCSARPGALAAILTNLQPNDVLFIDDIHRLSPVVEEILYPAMEDYHLDILIG